MSVINNRKYALIYIAPAFVIVVLLTLVPIFMVIVMSMSEWTYGQTFNSSTFIGLQNFINLFRSKELLHSLRLTLIFLFTSVTMEFFLGFTIAYFLNRLNMKVNSLLLGLFMLPMVMMPAMVGTVNRLFFHPRGLVNFFVESFIGFRVNWYSADYALIAVIIAEIWQWAPFFILTTYAGLQAIPQEPMEAALVDGAGSTQILFLVTLPLLTPVLFVSILIRTMECLRNFDMIFNFFAGGPGNATETLPINIYRTTIYSRALGFGSAKGFVLIALMAIGAIVLSKLLIKYSWNE